MKKLVTFEQFAAEKAKETQVQLEQELNTKREAAANSFKELLSEFGVASISELSEEDRPKFNEKLGALTESALLLEGTRGQFGIIDKKGNIQSVYTHSDSYPKNMLPLIKKYYKNSKDVNGVIAKGGNSGLDAPDKINFYGDDLDPMTGKKSNIDNYLKKANDDGDAEFVYLYDEADKKWYMADIYGETGLVPAFEALVAEAVAISGKRTAKKLALRLDKLFTAKLPAIAADKATHLGFLKELYFYAMEDANFSREANVTMNMIKGRISPLEVKVEGLDGEVIRISAKTIKTIADKYYTDLANAGDWSGIGITEGFAMYLDQIGESAMAQALLDSFNAQFEGEEKRVSRTERLYEFSQRKTNEALSQRELKSMAEVIADATTKVDKTKAKVVDFEMLDTPGRIAGFYIQKANNKLGAPSRYWITDSGEVVMAFRYDTFGPEKGTIAEVGDKLADVVKKFKANESVVTEAEIKSDDEFKEYAFTVLQKAFGEDFDEEKAQEVVDGILGKVDGDYGKAAGILQSSLG